MYFGIFVTPIQIIEKQIDLVSEVEWSICEGTISFPRFFG
jgi:hypothetical protein